jgi:thiamine-phosphate pyrophosphorylase
LFPSLYAILDPDLSPLPVADLALQLAEAGVELVQLRDKKNSSSEILARARELTSLLVPKGIRFILNDRADIAAMAGSGGVHVGQEDLPAELARRICGPSRWVGVSTHNLDQLGLADRTSADYIAIGPIFPTSTKENPDPVVGLDFIRAARQITRKPLVAIGGITLESAARVFRAGADSLAIIRDLVAVRDPAGRAKEFLAVARECRHRLP